jgi:hypothetical protein
VLHRKSDQCLYNHIFIKDALFCIIKVRVLQLKQEQEKCRVLEEALNVLAKEHHELEQSMASHLSTSPSHQEQHYGAISSPRSPRFYDTSDDEFYDAFEAGVFITSLTIILCLQVCNENMISARGSGKDLQCLISFKCCNVYGEGEQIFLSVLTECFVCVIFHTYIMQFVQYP